MGEVEGSSGNELMIDSMVCLDFSWTTRWRGRLPRGRLMQTEKKGGSVENSRTVGGDQ